MKKDLQLDFWNWDWSWKPSGIQEKAFLTDITKAFHIGPSATRVAAAFFEGKAETVFDFTATQSQVPNSPSSHVSHQLNSITISNNSQTNLFFAHDWTQAAVAARITGIPWKKSGKTNIKEFIQSIIRIFVVALSQPKIIQKVVPRYQACCGHSLIFDPVPRLRNSNMPPLTGLQCLGEGRGALRGDKAAKRSSGHHPCDGRRVRSLWPNSQGPPSFMSPCLAESLARNRVLPRANSLMDGI